MERGKHQRRVFLFEDTIIFAKQKKLRHHHDVPGSEIFEFRSAYKVRETVSLIVGSMMIYMYMCYECVCLLTSHNLHSLVTPPQLLSHTV